VVLLGRVLFRYTELPLAGVLFGSLFGAYGNPLSDFAAETHFMSSLFLLIAACVASTPLMKNIKLRLEAKAALGGAFGKVWNIAFYSVLPVIMLLLSTACLVGDSYNPFIYFQF